MLLLLEAQGKGEEVKKARVHRTKELNAAVHKVIVAIAKSKGDPIPRNHWRADGFGNPDAKAAAKLTKSMVKYLKSLKMELHLLEVEK